MYEENNEVTVQTDSEGPKKTRKVISLVAIITLSAICVSQCFGQIYYGSQKDKKSSDKDKYISVIEELYDYIQNNYVEEVDPQVLYEGALRGMLNALDDPYSSYLDQSDWRSLTDTTVGAFGGVGLSITKPNESTAEKPAWVEVVTPIDDTPGAKAGIQPGDKIIKIDDTDTDSITMEEVLSILRGEVGTDVTLTLRRGKNMTFERTLTRARIENPTVKYGMIGTLGYIRISEFSSSTTAKFQEALDAFDAEGYTGLIIDLRNNGGGLLSTAVNLADKFVDSGVIVATKSRISYENSTYYARSTKTTVKNKPVVVLINSGSASASEILAGALKDHKVAYLVGENSFGKGSVQIPSELLNNDGFKITVARYYSPSDSNIDKVGIPPDLEVLYPEFSEEQTEEYIALLESETVEKYVEDHQSMTEDDIASYAKLLQETYSTLELSFLRKFIRNEVYRTRTSLLYDLDYDIQLNAAVDLLNNKDVLQLTKGTKTLKQLENEREAAEAESGSSK